MPPGSPRTPENTQIAPKIDRKWNENYFEKALNNVLKNATKKSQEYALKKCLIFCLKNVKQKSKTVINQSGKSPGARVSHVKFGNGIIITKTGDTLKIAFEKVVIKTIKEDFVTEAESVQSLN